MEYKICRKCSYNVPLKSFKTINVCYTCNSSKLKTCRIYYDNIKLQTLANKNSLIISNRLCSRRRDNNLDRLMYRQLEELFSCSELNNRYIKSRLRDSIYNITNSNKKLIKTKYRHLKLKRHVKENFQKAS